MLRTVGQCLGVLCILPNPQINKGLLNWSTTCSQNFRIINTPLQKTFVSLLGALEMHPYPRTIIGQTEHCLGMMQTISKWSQMVQGKIRLIELATWLYGSPMNSARQSWTVLTLLWTGEGLYANWSCSQGNGCCVIMRRRGGRVQQGVGDTGHVWAVCRQSLDHPQNVHVLHCIYVDWTYLCWLQISPCIGWEECWMNWDISCQDIFCHGNTRRIS